MRFSLKFLLVAVPLLFSSSLIAQEVSYNLLDGEARMPKLRAGLTLFHFDAMFDQPEDITAGVGLFAGINLSKRLGFTGHYYLPVYQSGRNSLKAGGFLAFTNKEIEQTTRVNISFFGFGVNYINVPVQAILLDSLH
ncbi:MAG: hypothetical protein AAFV07_07465, partial [Bacteroidota bacterium]